MYFLPIPSRVNSRCQWIFVCQSERGPMLCSHVSEWRRMLMLYNSLIWYFQQCYVLLINLGPVFWIPKQIILISLQQSVTNCSAYLRSELLDLTTRLFFEDDHRTPIIKAIHWSMSESFASCFRWHKSVRQSPTRVRNVAFYTVCTNTSISSETPNGSLTENWKGGQRLKRLVRLHR